MNDEGTSAMRKAKTIALDELRSEYQRSDFGAGPRQIHRATPSEFKQRGGSEGADRVELRVASTAHSREWRHVSPANRGCRQPSADPKTEHWLLSSTPKIKRLAWRSNCISEAHAAAGTSPGSACPFTRPEPGHDFDSHGSARRWRRH